jgi:hypothetical protein
MSKPAKQKQSKELTVPERAVVALGYTTETEKELATLASSTTHITAITNADGRQQAHTALMVLRNTRVEIQKRGKDARDDATKFSKAVIAEENRLIGIIETEENRLQALRDGWDKVIEDERQAKVRAELERQAGIQKRIQWMRDAIPHAVAATASEGLAKLMAAIDKVVIDDTFEEAKDTAADVKAEVYAQLAKMHEAFVARETESKRLAAERAELDRRQAEQTERERLALENEAKERGRIARIQEGITELRGCQTLTASSGAWLIAEHIRDLDMIEIDAEGFAEFLPQARDAKEAGLSRLRALYSAAVEHEAQQQRQKEEGERQAAEAERIRKEGEALAAAQRAEQERKDREEREAREAEETARRIAEYEDLRRAKENFVPTLEQVVEVLADHFEVTNDRVLEWFADNCLNLRLARSKAA